MHPCALDPTRTHARPAPHALAAIRLCGAVAVGGVLAGCGVGSETTAAPIAAAAPAPAPKAAAPLRDTVAASGYAISVEQLFDWAERTYSTLLNARPNSFALSHNGQQFTVRAYPGERYLGAADGVVYGLGDFTAGQLQSFGSVQGFACQVVPASCGPAPSAWTGPITAPGEFVVHAKTVLDDLGHALAFWVERPAANGFAEQIMSSRRLAGGAWGAAQAVTVGRDGLGTTYKVAVDGASGRAMLVWSQLTSVGAYDLWARHFDPRSGWGDPARIEDLPKGIGDFDVGMDRQGHAIATWVQLEAPPQRALSSLWANRFVPGQGWGTATRIESFDSNLGMEGAPSLAVAADGQAHVAWIASNQHIVANRFVPASGWGTPTQLVTDAGRSQNFHTPRIGADDQGHALLAWIQFDTDSQPVQRTMVKRFAGSWSATHTEVGAPQPVLSSIAPLQLSMGAQGAAALAWPIRDGSVLASVAPANGAFATPVAVKPAGTAALNSPPQLGVDGAGNAVVTWTQRDVGFPSEDLWLSRFVAGSGWQPSSRHEESAEPAYTPGLSVNALGQAMLVWVQALSFNGPTRVQSRSFQ